jgi:tRNA(Leu) C34 or U34 (ribose-2'-O)-methylase TrmL
MSVLDRVVVVLYEPQDPINIAATARAMKNMGVSVLRLVRPVPYEPERLEFVAHDTADLIAAARHYPDLDAALADCVDVVAFTARRRAAKRTVLTPRHVAQRLLATQGAGPVAVLFGREDVGLPNTGGGDRALRASRRGRRRDPHPGAPAPRRTACERCAVRAAVRGYVSGVDRDRFLQDTGKRARHADGAIARKPRRPRRARDLVVASDVARGLANDRSLGHHTAHRVTL